MQWDRYRIKTTTTAEDFVSSMLADLGIEGVEIEDNVPLTSADTAKMFIDILPELPEDRGIAYVSFYLESGKDHSEILQNVRTGLEELRVFVDVGDASIEESRTRDIDWENNWKEFFHSFYVGDIFIKPTWEDAVPEKDARVTIEIDPGISFGTGKHETTQLCIRALDRYLQAGDRVLDLGCGSGILSIVALKLGASHVVGTDIDEDCITSSLENMKVNHLTEEKADFMVGNLITDKNLQEKLGTGSFDLVTANILADVIIPMAPFIPACLKENGIFIGSGIIDFKEEEVREAVEKAGLTVLEIQHQGEWVGIVAQKKIQQL